MTTEQRMSWNSFQAEMLERFPDATIEEDREGEIVIYPGLKHSVTPFGEMVVPVE